MPEIDAPPRSAERLSVLATLVLLCACGNNAGNGGAGSGLSLSTSSISFSAVQGGSVPDPQSIGVSITDARAALVIAGVPVGSTLPSWLHLSLNGSAGNWSVGVAIVSTNLSPGTYTTTVRIAIARSDESVIGYRDAQVNYAIRTGISVPTTSLSFIYSLGASAPPAAQTVDVFGTPGTQWAVTADQGWVVLGSGGGTVPGGVSVGVDVATLGSGTHRATVTFTGGGDTLPVAVTLDVGAPTLSVSPGSVTLGGASGHDFSAGTVALTLSTGTNGYAWTASTAPAWLQVSPTSGIASGTASTITLTPDAAGLNGGTYTGSITFTADLMGNPVTTSLSVTFNVDEHKVLPSDYGVAFASTPSLSKLTRTLRVRSNRNLSVGWSAASDQTWLTATQSGTTSDGLVLSADPTGLTADTVHFASVSLTSSDPSIPGTEVIRVGLWVGSTTPDAITSVNAQYQALVADPIRPFVYVHDGGADVTAYNVYTGSALKTLSIAGASLDGMAVSSDGSRLFLADAAGWAIVPVDLDAWSAGTPWPLVTFGFFSANLSLAYSRTNGYGVVFAGDGRLYDASAGARLSNVTSAGDAMAVSRDGARLCGVTTRLSPYTLTCRSLDSTTLGTGPMILGTARDGAFDVGGGNAHEVALNADGSRAYVAAGAPYEFTAYDTTSSATQLPASAHLTASPYPIAVKFGPDDRIYGAADVTISDPVDVWVYDEAGTLGSSFDLGGGVVELAISGEALRMIVLKGGSSLQFVTIPH